MRVSTAYIIFYIAIVSMIGMAVAQVAASPATVCKFGSYGKVMAESEGRC